MERVVANVAGTAAYTAFGEAVAGLSPADRFGYVGAHGYQAHDGVPFLHVGARYYDPGSGRFLQRDPVGIRGGMNTYGYVENEPLTSVDPDGERKVVQHLWQMEEEKKASGERELCWFPVAGDTTSPTTSQATTREQRRYGE